MVVFEWEVVPPMPGVWQFFKSEEEELIKLPYLFQQVCNGLTANLNKFISSLCVSVQHVLIKPFSLLCLSGQTIFIKAFFLAVCFSATCVYQAFFLSVCFSATCVYQAFFLSVCFSATCAYQAGSERTGERSGWTTPIRASVRHTPFMLTVFCLGW